MENTPISKESLMESARDAALKSYSPYSHFRVGAAVLCDDGSIVQGCNVENASYGLTICAERNAVFATVALGKRVRSIAVTCIGAPAGSPATLLNPCGACRQVLAEFMPDDALVLIDGVGERTVGQLIPESFRLASPAAA
jgi:cytidine deaminase